MNEDCEVGTGFFIMNIEHVFKGALCLEKYKEWSLTLELSKKAVETRENVERIFAKYQILTIAITFCNDNEFLRYMRRRFLRLKINLVF